MFQNTAHLYDAFYRAAGKDYGAEVRHLRGVLAGMGVEPQTWLDVACGTGRHLEFLGECHRVGVDLNPALLAEARCRCPDVEFIEADMTTLDLGRSFDVVSCLFSSIGYVGTEELLHSAVAAMGSHLVDGGVLLVEPWFQPEVWREGTMHALVIDESEIKGVRVSIASRVGDLAVVDMAYLVGTPDGFQHFEERHEMALFTWAQYRDAFEGAGLETVIDEEGPAGRGLIIGRR